MRLSLMLLALAPMLMIASCASPSSPASNTPRPVLTAPSQPVSTMTPKATGAIEARDPLCTVLSPIQLSHADSDGTKAQVIALNSVIDRVCKH